MTATPHVHDLGMPAGPDVTTVAGAIDASIAANGAKQTELKAKDLKTDQELAGLQMWVGMNTIFLIVSTIIFLRWATREERRDNEALRRKSRRLVIPPPSVNGVEPRQEPQVRA